MVCIPVTCTWLVNLNNGKVKSKDKDSNFTECDTDSLRVNGKLQTVMCVTFMLPDRASILIYQV